MATGSGLLPQLSPPVPPLPVRGARPSPREAGGPEEPGTLLQLITDQAAARGGATYLQHARSPRRVTFASLLEEVGRWDRWLDDRGVDRHHRVGLVIADPLEFATVYLAVMASGRWVTPIDPHAPTSAVTAAVQRLAPSLVVSDAQIGATEGVPWVRLDGAQPSPNLGAAWAEVGQPPRPGGGGGASGSAGGGASGGAGGGGAILASSGSTGTPKVIPLHQHQLLHGARAVARHHRLTPLDVGFNPLPLFHVNGEVVGLLAALYAGAGLVLDDRYHRTGFWALMERHQVTWINAVPAMLAHLSPQPPNEVIPGRIRFVRSASAPLPVATLRRFEQTAGVPVLETYGMTEAAGQITANPVDGPRKPGSVGRPVDIELRIVPGDTGPAGLPMVGDIEIRGPAVCPPVATGPDHPSRHPDPSGGWLVTGDLGYLDEDDYLYLVGRRDDVINRGGEKVYPREIEEVILEDARITDAVVIGADDPALGQVPVAYLTVRGVIDSDDADQALVVGERLRHRLAATLPPSRWPVAVHIVDRLPATSTGKVRRRAVGGEEVAIIVTLTTR
jgi:acyl-CoA synthetase (AMP-forming)/AMP-acid ligase II